jgi:hypothetical protein
MFESCIPDHLTFLLRHKKAPGFPGAFFMNVTDGYRGASVTPFRSCITVLPCSV